MNTNPQIYKTVGSLIFHKYEQLHSTSFRCKEIVKHQDTDYAFFSSKQIIIDYHNYRPFLYQMIICV